MAKLIRINPNESREVLHDVPGIGTSARIKHPEQGPPQRFYALRLLKPGKRKDGKETEYYAELSRDEALHLRNDLITFLGSVPREPLRD